MTYKEKTIEALKRLGGHGYLEDIYSSFQSIENVTLPKSWHAIIRATIERSSSDTDTFDGKDDLFYSVEGVGKGHWGLREYNDDGSVELSQDDDSFSEGKAYLRLHIQRERNLALITEAKKRFIKEHGRLYCEICGFDFRQRYGELGEYFIEAHHTKPVSKMTDGEKTKVSDIVMLCSNCHSMVHRRKPWLETAELKSILQG